ncbi:MAG: copper chaperone PCu(A)C [Aestuariivita sp.]|nr:copper chaperone PCu(A)C [Aestuariivita sp.]MCY4345295.1 copper chaperone PCu(A)C [Aestuariivita sp.]
MIKVPFFPMLFVFLLFPLTGVAAGNITTENSYVLSANPKTAAAYMELFNSSSRDDRLVSAESPYAARVELHTHTEDANGVMRMQRLDDGIDIPKNESANLMPGGNHIMLMGLNRELQPEEEIPITLTFEKSAAITLMVSVKTTLSGEETGHDHSHAHSDSH